MKTVDFSETIAASDLKVGRSRHLINNNNNNNNNNNGLYFERVTHLVTKLIFHEAL